MIKFMDTALQQIINTPEFLGAVMSKVANVSPELLVPEEFPKVAQHIFQGMSEYLQKEAGFSEDNVIAFTIGLAMTNPDFEAVMAKNAGFVDSTRDAVSSGFHNVVNTIGNGMQNTVTNLPQDGFLGKVRGGIIGASTGFQNSGVVNGGFDVYHKYLEPIVNGIKPFWEAHKSDIQNAAVGGLIGAGSNLLMGGDSPVSAGLVGAAGGYLAGPTIRDAYKNFTTPSTPEAASPNSMDAQKLKQQAEKVQSTEQAAQNQQAQLNANKPIGQ